MFGNLDSEVLIKRKCQVSVNVGLMLVVQLCVVTSVIQYTGTRERRYK